jgi:ABC-2 type transport system permease protein
MISLTRIRAILLKESRHILRDAQTLIIVLLMPVVMMFVYGYALTTDVKDIKIAIEDPSPNAESRALIQALDATAMFKVTAVANAISEPKEFFKETRVKAVFRIPATLSASLRTHAQPAAIGVLVDGSDPNLGTIIRNAARAAVVDPVLRSLHIEKPEVIDIQQTILYNPQQRSAVYFVPGLMVLILTMVSALLTSIALTREKELGTMAQLVVTPLLPFEVVIGKLVPYVILALADGALVLLIGRWEFGVRISGSVALLAALSVLYIIVALSIGLLISAITARQMHAMIAAVVITLMPTVILTGFVFPVASMPAALQVISGLLPATYFLRIVRAIILKGVGIDMLWKPVAILGAQALICIAVAVRKFRMAA